MLSVSQARRTSGVCEAWAPTAARSASALLAHTSAVSHTM
jgi:hypothetical protein